MNRIDECVEKIDYHKKEIRSCVVRINNTLDDTLEISEKTTEMIDKQGNQLNNIEDNLLNINSNLRVSQKILNGMKSIFGFGHLSRSGVKDIKTPIKNTLPIEKPGNTEDQSKKNKAALLETDETYDDVRVIDKRKNKRVNNSFDDTEFNKEIDCACDMFQQKLAILKGKSLEINEKVTMQNDQLDIINAKTDRTTKNVKNMDTKIIGLL